MDQPIILIATLCPLSDLREMRMREGKLMNWRCQLYSTGKWAMSAAAAIAGHLVNVGSFNN